MNIYQNTIKIYPSFIDPIKLERIVKNVKNALKYNIDKKCLSNHPNLVNIYGHYSKSDRDIIEYNDQIVKNVLYANEVNEFIKVLKEKNFKINTIVITGFNLKGKISLYLGPANAYLLIEPVEGNPIKTLDNIHWLKEMEPFKKEIIKILEENSEHHKKKYYAISIIYRIILLSITFFITYIFFSNFFSWIFALPLAAIFTNLTIIFIKLFIIKTNQRYFYSSPFPLEKYINPYCRISFKI